MDTVNFNGFLRSCILSTWNLTRLIICFVQWCTSKFVHGMSKKQNIEFIEIIHRSENFLIINKPYDTYINSNNPDKKNTLQLKLREMLPDLVNPKLCHEFHFVHRLDYPTSGIICIALNKGAARVASCAFENQKVQKFYLALVHGHVHQPCIVINKAIGWLVMRLTKHNRALSMLRSDVKHVYIINVVIKQILPGKLRIKINLMMWTCDWFAKVAQFSDDIRNKNSNHKMCTSDSMFCEKPRRSYTALMVLEHGLWKSKPATKILLAPSTGRRHQLRVHCNYIGHTIIGDYTYSEGKDTEPCRTYLHSFRLILNCDIENIDVRTTDPFDARMLSEYETTNVTRTLDESIFCDIYKLIE